jgi:hypothetical protein
MYLIRTTLLYVHPVSCWVPYFSAGASGLSTNMRPYIVTLDKRASKARAERRRCEVTLGESGGIPPGKLFEFRVSEMPFPEL